MKLCIVFAVAAMFCGTAQAQEARELQVGVQYAGTIANAPPGSCGCFLMHGAAADFALPVLRHVDAAVEVSGTHAGQVQGTARGLSIITLMAGPRFTQNLGDRMRFQAEALFGAARGFDAVFRNASGATQGDTATAFALEMGGMLDVRLRRRLSLRLLRVDYLQSSLPNGVNNRQKYLRAGAGVVLHFDTRGWHR